MLHAALLTAAVASAKPVLPARPPDGRYTYAFVLGGATMGTSTLTIDGTAGAGDLVVGELTDFSYPKLHAAATLRLDPATLRTRSYTGDFTIAAGTQHVGVTAAPGAMTVTVAGRTKDIAADPSAPIEFVGDNLLSGAFMLPALVDVTDARTFTLAVISTGTPLIVTIGRDGTAVRPAMVPAGDVLISAQFAGLTENIWYDPATFVVHDVQLPAQQTEFRLSATTALGAATPPPAATAVALPTPLPHFSSTDVTFASADGTSLAGTLTVPDGPATPRATVVLVHGSGAEDRDETIGPNPIFLQLSNALSNAGYNVLRYDKRSVGKSGGAPYSGTREKLLDDVAAAVRFARTQPAVDAKRIVVLGHSEGGELVPTIAVRDPAIAGIILMAPPALPLWRVFLQQDLASHPEASRAETEKAALAKYAQIRTSSDPREAWLRSSIDVDPIDDIKRVHAPILILQGEGDAQVLAADLPRLAGAARATNARVTVRTFPNVNHLFEPVVGGPQTPLTALAQYMRVPARIDQRVLDAIIGWLATAATPTKAFPRDR